MMTTLRVLATGRLLGTVGKLRVHPPCVHPNVLAGDAAALVACEEDREVGDVFGYDVRDWHPISEGESRFGVFTGGGYVPARGQRQ